MNYKSLNINYLDVNYIIVNLITTLATEKCIQTYINSLQK